MCRIQRIQKVRIPRMPRRREKHGRGTGTVESTSGIGAEGPESGSLPRTAAASRTNTPYETIRTELPPTLLPHRDRGVGGKGVIASRSHRLQASETISLFSCAAPSITDARLAEFLSLSGVGGAETRAFARSRSAAGITHRTPFRWARVVSGV